jgi:amino acid transporter
VRRAFGDMNPTVRGFLIIAAIVVVIVALQLQATVAALFLIVQIVFLIAIAYFIYRAWRERRGEIATWPTRARVVFYGAALLLIVNMASRFFVSTGGGLNLIVFLAVLVCGGFAMWRVWRDQHAYGY